MFGMWSTLEGMGHILIERETIGDNKINKHISKPNEHYDKLLGFLFMLFDKEEDVCLKSLHFIICSNHFFRHHKYIKIANQWQLFMKFEECYSYIN